MARVNAEELSLKDKVIFINRVAKVVKGGKRFNFCALVAVGDGHGWVGVGKGKAAEVPAAISKFGSESIILKPAVEGTGIIAGGAVRVIVELAGIHNIIAKTLGRGNPFNAVRATLDGLTQLKNPEEMLRLRREGAATGVMAAVGN